MSQGHNCSGPEIYFILLRFGNVNIAIQGANVPGANTNVSATAPSQRRSRLSDRGLVSAAKNAVEGTLLALAAVHVFNTDPPYAAVSNLNTFNQNKNITLPPLDVDKQANLLDQSISCPPISASVKVDVDAKAHAVATIGGMPRIIVMNFRCLRSALAVAASGTIVPPSISDFSIITSKRSQGSAPDPESYTFGKVSLPISMDPLTLSQMSP